VYQAEAERLCHFLESLKSLELAQKTVAFLIIAHAILQRYQVEKQKLSFLDYDDLIHLTAQLLQQPGYASWILYKLDGGIDHILVDEAQDTNQQQWQVIQTLVSEFLTPDKLQRSLFVVGDSKQSIYSFQGADPKDFYRLKKQFSDYTQSLGKKWKDISLSVSFRSAPAILMAVDAVFSDPTRRSIITVDSQEVCHLPARSSASGLVEFWPIIMPEPQEKEEEPWPLPIIHYPNVTSKKRLAALVAEKIEGLLASHSILAATKQVIQPRDILVLVRKRSEFVDFLTKELRRRLIPVSGSDRLSFTDHLAVKDLIALGQFLLLPDDDLALACLLKSPLIGISEEVLFDLSYKRQGTLWAEMIRRQRDFPLIQEGYQLLADLLDKVDVISPYELYHMVFTRYQGKRRFLERLGRDCEDVLDEFLGMATSFQQSKGESLQAFIQYLITKTHIIKRDTADLQHNQVRIMTVHGSKGLQAPIVILPEDVCPRSKTDFFLWDISPYNKAEMVYLRPSSDLDTAHTKMLKNRIQRDAEAEELRLLYVALTRAQDRLYLCGSSESQKEPSPQSWYEIVRKALSDRLYLDDGGVYRYEPIPSQKIIAQSGFRNPAIPLPNWTKTAPILPPYAEKAPSKRRTNAAMERGVLIHGLFELLPGFPERQWCGVAAAYLGSQGQDAVLFKEEIQKVITILKDPKYASFFSDDSQSEVSITGVVDGETILGRIDRLCITETEIIILDYKTGEIPRSEKEIPSLYRQQLLIYGRILSTLYPDHKCRLMLLWTEGPLIMEMSMDS
jgi:ATP-dependent helicase/nuclease subunit A